MAAARGSVVAMIVTTADVFYVAGSIGSDVVVSVVVRAVLEGR